MEYIQVLDSLALLLNKKGRQKKGINSRQEFKGFLGVLKNDFGQEISTQFLFNLMKDNKSLNNYQKRRKIQNLIVGLDKEKRSLFFRELEVMNYRTDVIEYARKKKGFVYPVKCELSADEQTQIKQIDEIKKVCGVGLVKRAEKNFNERQRIRRAFNGNKVFVKSVKVEHIGKEFIASKQKKFNFIGV